MSYLDPKTDDHALVFQDYPKAEMFEWMNPANYVECPRCFGHGGWNLRVNAYPLRDRPDTPEARHRHCHFRMSCGNCNGYGYVRVGSKDASCLHEWGNSYTVGNCLHEYTCIKCGSKRVVDSSG